MIHFYLVTDNEILKTTHLQGYICVPRHAWIYRSYLTRYSPIVEVENTIEMPSANLQCDRKTRRCSRASRNSQMTLTYRYRNHRGRASSTVHSDRVPNRTARRARVGRRCRCPDARTSTWPRSDNRRGSDLQNGSALFIGSIEKHFYRARGTDTKYTSSSEQNQLNTLIKNLHYSFLRWLQIKKKKL